MRRHEFIESCRRRITAEEHGGTRNQLLTRIARNAALAGVVLAAMLYPAALFGTWTAGDFTGDVKDLPLALSDAPNPQTTRLLSSSGNLIAYFYQENREDVPLAKIAPIMRRAILSIEDVRFYDHGALDLEGTVRALVTNATTGSTQGGSTITQQLVKLLSVQQSTSKEAAVAAVARTPARKLRELKLAIAYEQTHTKNEILERYLNTAYFGGGAHGIAAAAMRWFSVTPDQLSPVQAATLAGLVKNPAQFDPQEFPEAAAARRNDVLGAMARNRVIAIAEAQKLAAEPVRLNPTRFANGCVTSVGAFSCDYVRRYLLAEPALGKTVQDREQALDRGGLTIKSNIDIHMQEAANDAVRSHVNPTDHAIGSLAMVEPGTGKVRGIAQSRPMGTDISRGESFLDFSVPTKYGDSAGFQAGSTFKFFTLAAAMAQGIPVTKTYDASHDLVLPPGSYTDCQGSPTGAWTVANSTSSGVMNMYRGARESVNTYFAQLERDAGLCNVVQMAREMGIKVSANDEVPSFTLGVVDVSTLDMAAAYATAASGGLYCKPEPVSQILDASGRVIKSYSPQCTRVLTEDQAAQINDILTGLQQPGGFGYQHGTALNIPSAAKTGTTQNNKAVWYVGYTPRLATAAMIAGADAGGQPIPLNGQQVNGHTISFVEAAGSALAGPMWAAAMQVIQAYLEPVAFATPPELQPDSASPDHEGNDNADGHKPRRREH
jgi:membrane peptidoglycan carboxypeptidase